MNNRLLIKNAKFIVTMDERNSVLPDADMLIVNGQITAIDKNIKCDDIEPDRIIDATDMILYPGLVNTHHHLYQLLTRNYPRVSNMELYDWLKTLYGVWSHIDNDMLYSSALVNIAELVKYGCTTTSDQHYIFPVGNKELIDQTIEAARLLGVRFHAGRGSLNKGVSDGGLPPDEVVETKKAILFDSERLIRQYHDPNPGSMCQIVLAPCSPHSLTADLMIDSAALAREYGVKLHTHLAVTEGENEMMLRNTGMRPLEYMHSLGFIGEDVWYAHGNKFTEGEIQLLADTNTGLTHCAVSNQIISAGVANVAEMIKRGVKVGLAVDGSTANDSSSLLAEIKSSYNVQRLTYSYGAPKAKDILQMATRGSAECLGRKDIGTLEIGKMGDCFLVNANCAELAGALEDPVSIPAVVGINKPVDYTIVGGNVIYEKGQFASIDESNEVAKLNKQSQRLRNWA